MTPSETASLFDLADDGAAAATHAVPPSPLEPGRALADAARKLADVLASGNRLTAAAITSAVRDAWRT